VDATIAGGTGKAANAITAYLLVARPAPSPRRRGNGLTRDGILASAEAAHISAPASGVPWSKQALSGIASNGAAADGRSNWGKTFSAIHGPRDRRSTEYDLTTVALHEVNAYLRFLSYSDRQFETCARMDV